MIDDYFNKEITAMNDIGKEYDFRMDKRMYQDARSEIKHFINNGGHLVDKENIPLFEDYCRQVFEKYLPKEV